MIRLPRRSRMTLDTNHRTPHASARESIHNCLVLGWMHTKKPITHMTMPINRLPNEMLHLRALLCRQGRPIPVTASPIADGYTSLFWFVDYRRDVAHATSALWSHINVGRKAEWLQLCLTRSASTALDIVFTSGEFPSPQLGILLPHARRIRTLRFDIVREEWRAVLRRLLREPMPPLEELRYCRIQVWSRPTRRGWKNTLRKVAYRFRHEDAMGMSTILPAVQLIVHLSGRACRA